MIDALLWLSVTDRQLIMPLVGSIERLGMGHVNHAELERVQRQIDKLAQSRKQESSHDAHFGFQGL